MKPIYQRSDTNPETWNLSQKYNSWAFEFNNKLVEGSRGRWAFVVRCHNVKIGKEASEITEGKSYRMRYELEWIQVHNPQRLGRQWWVPEGWVSLYMQAQVGRSYLHQVGTLLSEAPPRWYDLLSVYNTLYTIIYTHIVILSCRLCYLLRIWYWKREKRP